MQWHELWDTLRHASVGQEVACEPDDLKAVQPILEISESIRPRLVLVADLPDGRNLLVGISFHTDKQAFQGRGRMRYADGRKRILVATPWRTFADEQEFGIWLETFMGELEALILKQGGKIAAKLAFGPEATEDEILDAFVASGKFDVVQVDPEERTARRVA